MSSDISLSVLIPAHNEASEIAECLTAVFASSPLPEGTRAEVLVLANGCDDDTAKIAAAQTPGPAWELKVLDMPEGNKLKALNQGDAAAQGKILVYLDADVRVSAPVLAEIYAVLNTDTPAYASASPNVQPGASPVSRAYGRLWVRLPFVTHGVPGFGVFAMNRAGRARWTTWPEIIADDTFARLMFTPAERHRVDGRYSWPLVQGFRNLVRVRRRQNEGVREIAEKFPQLLENDDKFKPSTKDVAQLAWTDPLGFLAYAGVTLAVKTPLFRSQVRWTRGR